MSHSWKRRAAATLVMLKLMHKPRQQHTAKRSSATWYTGYRQVSAIDTGFIMLKAATISFHDYHTYVYALFLNIFCILVQLGTYLTYCCYRYLKYCISFTNQLSVAKRNSRRIRWRKHLNCWAMRDRMALYQEYVSCIWWVHTCRR